MNSTTKFKRLYSLPLSVRADLLRNFWRKIFFITLTLFYPYDLKDSTSYNLNIFWNFGYSNWISIVQTHHCFHIDPGGSKAWQPQMIHHFCNLRRPQFKFFHQDRFHNKYEKEISLLYLIQSNISLWKELKQYRFHLSSLHENIYVPYKVIHDILITGHVHHLQFKALLKQNKSLILSLPNHGQSRYWNRHLIQKSRKFLMRITGSKSKNNHIHQNTQKKFSSLNIPIVYKPIWGHLIFEK